MGSDKFGNSAKSGYNKGTIRSDIWYLVVSKDVRRHHLISISYISQGPCHGRGREFESRRPRHSFSLRGWPYLIQGRFPTISPQNTSIPRAITVAEPPFPPRVPVIEGLAPC